MKKLSIFALFFLVLGLLFNLAYPPSASAQGPTPIAVAILLENENAPQWNPENNDGTTFPCIVTPCPGTSPAQGFGTRIERGTELNGGVAGLINGTVQIIASSIITRDGTSEAAALGTGQAHGSISVISVNGGQLQGRFAGEIDLTNIEAIAVGTISAHYNLHGEENLTSVLEGFFLFPIPDGLNCSPFFGCYVIANYSLDEGLNNTFPIVRFPDEYSCCTQIPDGQGGLIPLWLPRVKLIAFLYD